MQDHLGSTNALTDANGSITEQASYDSFGNASNQLSTRYQFTGREYDNFTGLHYYRARFYDGKLGRFISEDPIGLAGGINQYGYVGGNPLNFTDPFGLQEGPVNYLRNPFSADRWILNGVSNTVSDVLGLDAVAQWSWTAGDYRCSTSDRAAAGAKLIGWTAFQAAGGRILGAAAKGIGSVGGSALSRLRIPNALCFEAGTLIQTESGLKKIEEIKKGDKVLSYNVEKKTNEYRSVAQTFSREAEDVWELKVEGEEKPLGVTSEHPFYVRSHQARDSLSSSDDEEGEWKSVKDLKIGDEIKTSKGAWAKVISTKVKGNATVYNFEVENNHNYFVGNIGLLAHNDCSSLALELQEEIGGQIFRLTSKVEGTTLNISSEMYPSAHQWFYHDILILSTRQ